MDVLSEVLRGVRLTGAVYFDVHGRCPFVGTTPGGEDLARVMPEAERIIAFHIMIDGACWAFIENESEPPLRIESGDAILIPHADVHVLASEPSMSAEPRYDLYHRPNDQVLPIALTELEGDGERFNFVCGYLGCDVRPFNPILNALPRMLHLGSTNSGRDFTHDLIRAALSEREKRRPGSETILARMSELVFVQAVRQYIDGLTEDSQGWLAGLRDPHIGAALALIHGQPSADWSVDKLAKGVGLSRSKFSERFTYFVEDSPMHYLTQWRMQLAARALERPGINVARAAAEVGYQSEAAFNRAFKKSVGVTPGQWQRQHLN